MALSFSAAAKAELCRDIPHKRCCCLAEAFGILLYCNSFSAEGIKIITESREFAWMLPRLFQRAFDVEFDSFPSMESPDKLTFQIFDPDKIELIMDSFGFAMEDTLSLHVNWPVVEEVCCRTAFLRGAFLAGGSVTDPIKGYHMELTTTHQAVARETRVLIHDAMDFTAKSATRNGGVVLYLKQSEQISELLALLGAGVASMGIMEARLEKELNNKVNRRCNCDDANISKVVDAAQGQLAAINTLKELGLLEKLPAKLKQAADARENNPESSLSELAALMDPPITKPAMNQRLKKLIELAREAVK
jgi:DNA-binding protein WhiA